jgi:hypothetical protein
LKNKDIYYLTGIPKLFIKGAINGGLQYAKSGFYKNCVKLDINTLYPYCYTETPIPTGLPVVWNGENINNYPFYVIEINVLNYKNYHDFIYYPKVDKAYKTKTLITLDKYALKDLIKRCDLRYEIIRGYLWQTTTPPPTDFINELYEKKRTAEGEAREIYKLILYSLYGKLNKRTKPTKVFKRDNDVDFNNIIESYGVLVEKFKSNGSGGGDIWINQGIDDLYNLNSWICGMLSKSHIVMNDWIAFCFYNKIEIYYVHTDCLLMSAYDFHRFQMKTLGSKMGDIKVLDFGDYEVKEYPARAKLVRVQK